MPFKESWERATIPKERIEKILSTLFDSIPPYEQVLGGCVNVNVRLPTKNQLLRIYLRDQEAPFKENKIAELLTDLPLPTVESIGSIDGLTYALTSLMPGVPMRELKDFSSLSSKTGELLAKIHSFRFSSPGFFNKDLKPHSQGSLLLFALDIIPKELPDLTPLFQRLADHLPSEASAHLVHGDFDPSNLLVNKKGEISAILDWEFAFSGSPLWDVANWLRYADQMPSTYETDFLKSYQHHAGELPKNYPTTIRLLNLISLLDCLTRRSNENDPRSKEEIHNLIKLISSELQDQ